MEIVELKVQHIMLYCTFNELSYSIVLFFSYCSNPFCKNDNVQNKRSILGNNISDEK